MNRDTAFRLLAPHRCGIDEAVQAVACAVGITPRAVYLWPECGHLPRSVADKVLAAAVRRRAAALVKAREPISALELDAVTLPE